MRILCWNLEKRDLVDWGLSTFSADIGLFQEYDASFSPRAEGYFRFEAVSFETFGTSIFSRERASDTTAIVSPHGDLRAKIWKGLVYKATAIATFPSSLSVVSFHGYNGTPFRDPQKLVDHVDAVLKSLSPDGPCVFAGDFNTFTQEHHDAVDKILATNGFSLQMNVPYDDQKILDLVYTKDCQAVKVESGFHLSDHPYLVFDIFNK